MATDRTEELFAGDFYAASEDVTRGVALGDSGFTQPSFLSGKGAPGAFPSGFEKVGLVDSFGPVEFLGPATGVRLAFGAEVVEVPSRPLEGRSYMCATGAAPSVLESLQDFFASSDAVVQQKPGKCSLKVQMVVKHKPLNLKVLFSKTTGQVGVSFVRKQGDSVDFTTTTTEAAAHVATSSGRDFALAGATVGASLPGALGLPLGLQPPTGFLAPPPLGFEVSAPLETCSVTEDDMAPILTMLEDTSGADGPLALLQLLDSDPALTAKVLLERWCLVEKQLRDGCVIAASALCSKVLETTGRAGLAKGACDIALDRFALEGALGRRQLARLLHQASSLLADDQLCGRLSALLKEAQADTKTERHLSEAVIALQSRA